MSSYDDHECFSTPLEFVALRTAVATDAPPLFTYTSASMIRPSRTRITFTPRTDCVTAWATSNRGAPVGRRFLPSSPGDLSSRRPWELIRGRNRWRLAVASFKVPADIRDVRDGHERLVNLATNAYHVADVRLDSSLEHTVEQTCGFPVLAAATTKIHSLLPYLLLPRAAEYESPPPRMIIAQGPENHVFSVRTELNRSRS